VKASRRSWSIVGALVVAALTVAGVLLYRSQHTQTTPPTLTASVEGRSITVDAKDYCDLQLQNCRHGDIAQLPMRAGDTLTLALPHDVVDAPWWLIAVYRAPDGTSKADTRYFRPGETAKVTVPSTPEQALAGVEIHLPAAVVDHSGDPYSRALWAVDTSS
jgi:hypothetical protein